MEKTERIEKYFLQIDESIKKAYKIAIEARAKGLDPSEKVEIMLVKDMAERVEGLISVENLPIITHI